MATSLDVLRSAAIPARGLVEETGIATTPDDLPLRVVTPGGSGNVGVLFLVPCLRGLLFYGRFAVLAPCGGSTGS